MIEIRNMNETDIPPLLDLVHKIGKELNPDMYWTCSITRLVIEQVHYKNRGKGIIWRV
jgi:hypothetical protein